MTFGGLYLDLKDTNSGWLDGLVLAFLQTLVVTIDDLEIVRIAHVVRIDEIYNRLLNEKIVGS